MNFDIASFYLGIGLTALVSWMMALLVNWRLERADRIWWENYHRQLEELRDLYHCPYDDMD